MPSTEYSFQFSCLAQRCDCKTRTELKLGQKKCIIRVKVTLLSCNQKILRSMTSTAIHFFKIILTTTLADEKLKLPKTFTRKYGDRMSNPVFLKQPDGTEWKICWTKHDGEIWFQKGWKEFATYYSLDHGHLLFFEYEGTSHFDVLIFDNSSLEIDYPSHGTHEGKDNLVQISDDSVEILDEQCHDGKDNLVQIGDDSIEIMNEQCHDGKHNLVQITDDSVEILDEQCHDGKDNNVQINDDSVEILDQQFSCKNTRKKSTVSSPQPCKKMKNSITTNVERSSNGENLHQHDQTRSSSSQEATFMKQKLDEDEGIGIFNTQCPQVEQLTSTPLNKSTTFSSEHPSFTLIMKPSFINEDDLEIPPHFAEKYLKKLHALVTFEVLDGRTWPVIYSAPKVIGGWQKFASENNLNVGDVCVFEMIQKIQRLAFKVSIFQGAEEPSSHISQGGKSSRRTSSRALKEGSKFRTENPIFMVTLKLQGNSTRCPHVPRYFVGKYFVNMNKNVIMIQFRKKLWPVTLVLKGYNRDYYLSGALSAGWRLFSRENKLQKGDVCIFELVNRENATLDLHVFRGNSVMH